MIGTGQRHAPGSVGKAPRRSEDGIELLSEAKRSVCPATVIGAESMHQWMRRWLRDLGQAPDEGPASGSAG